MKSTHFESGLTLAKSLYFSVPLLQKDYYKEDDWHWVITAGPMLITHSSNKHWYRIHWVGIVTLGFWGMSSCSSIPLPAHMFFPKCLSFCLGPSWIMLALQDQGHHAVGTTLAPTAKLIPDFLSSQIEISIPEFSLSLLDWISRCLWPDSHGFPFGFGSKS